MSGGAAGLASVMQQSLNPRKPERSSGHYPDKKAVVAAYKRMVQTVLESRDDRAKLHKALKEFHGTLLVEDLMENLNQILTDPRRRQLYLAIRPLIPPRMRAEYNSFIPHVPTFEKKIVHLKQQGNRSLGFNIRGGKEFDCGIYITAVQPSSKAAQAGIKVGDEIIRINGLILTESTHDEVVNLIKLKKTLTLTLRVVGMIPEQNAFGKISWKTTVEKKARGGQVNPHANRLNTAILKSTKKIRLNLESPDDVLGLGIKSTADRSSGVLIAEIMPNSVAHNSGLEIGDELIDVSGHSLIGVTHKEAIRLLKSSNTLMLTIRVKDPRAHMLHRDDPLSNPPDNFELTPHDFDIDSELIPSGSGHTSHGFVLKSKHEVSAEQQKRLNDYDADLSTNRFSLLGMEVPDYDQTGHAPIIAAPAAVGYGPTVAMPTLMGMMPSMEDFEEDIDRDGDEDTSNGPNAQVKLRMKSPGRDAAALNARESMAFADVTQLGDQLNMHMPESIASIFQHQSIPGTAGTAVGGHGGRVGGEGRHLDKPPSPVSIPRAQISKGPPVKKKSPPLSDKSSNKNASSNAGSQNLTDSFQFPVVPDDESSSNGSSDKDEAFQPPATSPLQAKLTQQQPGNPQQQQQRHVPDLTRKPSASALKKSPSTSSEGSVQLGGARKKRAPAFNDSVEIINVDDNRASGGLDNGKSKDYIHPSNMEFSEKVLQGRRVAFHTLIKDGPIKLAIRGGTDTPLGGAIIISRILEGGAAARYGKLNVGDQILVCDGVSLIDVTHDEAAQALKRAMDMEANSIDLVVAVNPDVEQPTNEDQPQIHSPRTPWPLPEDTVCDDHPMAAQYDYAKSSRRAHSGFTLRGKEKEGSAQNAHTFLPPAPN